MKRKSSPPNNPPQKSRTCESPDERLKMHNRVMTALASPVGLGLSCWDRDIEYIYRMAFLLSPAQPVPAIVPADSSTKYTAIS